MTCWVRLCRASAPHQVKRSVTGSLERSPEPPEPPPEVPVPHAASVAPAARPRESRRAARRESWESIAESFGGVGAYFMPVVAMPLMRYRWPIRKARKIGRRETTLMANMDPHEVE